MVQKFLIAEQGFCVVRSAAAGKLGFSPACLPQFFGHGIPQLLFQITDACLFQLVLFLLFRHLVVEIKLSLHPL